MNPVADKEDIRIEYAAISSRVSQLSSFRFSLAGLYVAAVGVIASADKPVKANFILIIWLTLCLWVVELRTRSFLENIRRRGLQIENQYWGYKAAREEQPYISHWGTEKFPKSKLFFWTIRAPVSHSLGFDLLFLGVIAYALYQLLTL
jgi:hypothetical protein